MTFIDNRKKLLNVDTIEEVALKFDDYFGNIEKKTELVGIREALGRYCAEEVMADRAMPEFRRAVVDGYAVQAKDTFGVSDSVPVLLSVTGAVEMGAAAGLTVSAGEAVYVPTGGMMPEGADAMVMIEYVDHLDEGTIAVNKAAAPNSGFMNIGDDFSQSARFFEPGHRLSVRDIGILAVLGKSRVLVYQKPTLSIISTGDELVDVDAVPGPGQIRDLNSYTISAFAEAAGASINEIKIVHDDFNKFRAIIAEALERSDLVIISGGSSAGNKDFTAETINSFGDPGVFTHGLAIKPGKPTILGGAMGKPIIGLPGHPMSAIVVFKVVVEAFIRKAFFGNTEEPLQILAALSENIHAGEGRTQFQLVSLIRGKEGYLATPIRAKSGSISQLMKADGYIKIDSLTEGLYAGNQVFVTLFNYHS